MRSLLLLDTSVQQLSSSFDSSSNTKLHSITTDPATNVLYALVETLNTTGTTELSVLIANGKEVRFFFSQSLSFLFVSYHSEMKSFS